MSLATAVVLMFVAGVLLWFNVNWKIVPNDLCGKYVAVYPSRKSDEHTFYETTVHGYGWPMVAMRRPAYVLDGARTPPIHVELHDSLWDAWGISLNVVVASSILIAVWAINERIVRRITSELNQVIPPESYGSE